MLRFKNKHIQSYIKKCADILKLSYMDIRSIAVVESFCVVIRFLMAGSNFPADGTPVLVLQAPSVLKKGWFSTNRNFTHFLLTTVSTEAPIIFSDPHDLSGVLRKEIIPFNTSIVETCGSHVLKCI